MKQMEAYLFKKSSATHTYEKNLQLGYEVPNIGIGLLKMPIIKNACQLEKLAGIEYTIQIQISCSYTPS